MQMNELMTRKPTTLHIDEPIHAAAITMREQDVGFLPVCDDNHRVQGILTDRDIAMRIVAAKRSSDTPVRDVMTADVVSCHVSDEVHVAEQLMRERQVSRLVCLNADGTLGGVVALADVVTHDDNAHAGAVVRDVKADHHAP